MAENRIGRPPKWESPEQLAALIEEYFESCFEDRPILDKTGRAVMLKNQDTGELEPLMIRQRIRPWTITGLAVYLDTNRQTILNYQKDSPFIDTITRAKHKIEAFAEESLWEPKIATGVIFNMKNNYGWKDKTEQEVKLTDASSVLFDDGDDDRADDTRTAS